MFAPRRKTTAFIGPWQAVTVTVYRFTRGPTCPRSPGTHIVGPWVTDSFKFSRVLRTGTQYIGNWAFRACFRVYQRQRPRISASGARPKKIER